MRAVKMPECEHYVPYDTECHLCNAKARDDWNRSERTAKSEYMAVVKGGLIFWLLVIAGIAFEIGRMS